MDRNGTVVWTFPPSFEYRGLRNIQLNKDGNITYTDSKLDYEIDLQNHQLWQSPAVVIYDSVKVPLRLYHHDIRKLANGDFLCIAEKEVSDKDAAYNVVFEISRDGKVKWLFDEQSFYPRDVRTHINSAVLDNNEEYLYISDRDIDAILKVNVQTCKPVYSIGYRCKGVPFYENNFFVKQHSLGISSNGNLSLFNNNMRGQRNNGFSSVMILSQPEKEKGPKLIWEYVLDFDKKEDNLVGKLGDIYEFSNGNILIGGGTNSRTFEVNRKKEIVWHSIGQLYDSVKRSFVPYMMGQTNYQSGYRVDFAKTLYPTRFIAYVNDSRGTRQLAIMNTGNYQDKYTCTIQEEKATSFETQQIAPGQSVFIPLTKYKTAESVLVMSERNTFCKKELPLK